MDPITAAVLAVLPALAGDTIKAGVKDAYDGLKAVIQRKWGEAAPVCKAITALEQDPASKAQAAVLDEKAAAAKASADPDVVQALKHLTEQLQAHGMPAPAVGTITVTISGGNQAGAIIGSNIGSVTR